MISLAQGRWTDTPPSRRRISEVRLMDGPCKADSLDRIPDPHPTSMTTAPLNTAELLSMKSPYDKVLTVSFNMVS